MRILLYCVLRAVEPHLQISVPGVGGYPVAVIRAGRLGGVSSEIHDADLSPDVSRILTYQKVVESYHRKVTVIPMRYGVTFQDRNSVEKFLLDRQGSFLQAMEEINDGVEMGVRVLISKTGTSSRRTISGEGHEPKDAEDRREKSGRAYLLSRKARYDEGERLSEEESGIIERCQTTFAGLYFRFKREEQEPETSRILLNGDEKDEKPTIVSLYFLVPRRSVADFKSAFRTLCSHESARLLLSGPWPPYNFVTDLLAP